MSFLKRSPARQHQVQEKRSGTEPRGRFQHQPGGEDPGSRNARHGRGDGPRSGSMRTAGQRPPVPRYALAASVLALAVALGATLSGALNPSASDTVTEDQKQTLQRNFDIYTATSKFPLALVAPHERKRALDTMNLAPEEQAQVASALEDGTIQLAWVTLLDNMAQDGDVVGFRSSVWPQVNVVAKHQPQTFAIVYPPDGIVEAVGIHDGGGGITVDIITNGSQLSYPWMAVGQTVRLPVAPF